MSLGGALFFVLAVATACAAAAYLVELFQPRDDGKLDEPRRVHTGLGADLIDLAPRPRRSTSAIVFIAACAATIATYLLVGPL